MKEIERVKCNKACRKRKTVSKRMADKVKEEDFEEEMMEKKD